MLQTVHWLEKPNFSRKKLYQDMCFMISPGAFVNCLTTILQDRPRWKKDVRLKENSHFMWSPNWYKLSRFPAWETNCFDLSRNCRQLIKSRPWSKGGVELTNFLQVCVIYNLGCMHLNECGDVMQQSSDWQPQPGQDYSGLHVMWGGRHLRAG